MARPTIEIDMQKLAAFMRLKPALSDCAAFFQCSDDTIERRIREHTVSDENPKGLSYATYREQNMVHTRFSLVRTAIQKAEKGDNVMLIFCLKNLCGWRDKQPGEDTTTVVNNVSAKSDQELDQRIKELISNENLLDENKQ